MARKIRVLIAKPGLDGHDRGMWVLARKLRDDGMEVIYMGIRQTPEQIADAAVQEDVDVVGLSCHSGAHMTLFPKVSSLIRQSMENKALLVGGGIIPDKDREALKKLGFAEIFGPGNTLDEISDFIKNAVK